MGDNRIINGDMRIDQRNNGASGTASATRLIDGFWRLAGSKGNVGAYSAGPSALAVGFGYALISIIIGLRIVGGG